MASSPTVTWTEHVHAALARAGLKRGGARERVIELLAGQPCALSAVQIEDALRERGTPTGRASIYRVLDLLNEHGLVERVAVGQGQQALFERVAPDGEHHHHLLCEQCGRLVAFDDPGSSAPSIRCLSASESASSTTTWCCAAPASAATDTDLSGLRPVQPRTRPRAGSRPGRRCRTRPWPSVTRGPRRRVR